MARIIFEKHYGEIVNVRSGPRVSRNMIDYCSWNTQIDNFLSGFHIMDIPSSQQSWSVTQ